MLNSGKVTTIDNAKGSGTTCNGINTAGATLSDSMWNSTGLTRGFLRQAAGKFKNIGPAGSQFSEAFQHQ